MIEQFQKSLADLETAVAENTTLVRGLRNQVATLQAAPVITQADIDRINAASAAIASSNANSAPVVPPLPTA